MKLELKHYFSPLMETDDEDAERIAAALNQLGYWTPDSKTGLVPFNPDYRFFEAIRKFQMDHGLFHDGVLRPGGETETALNIALDENAKSGGSYIWRTVHDGKSRPAHAAREGQLFRWNENLEGGAPGEDYNCRCWAESYMGNDYKTKKLYGREPKSKEKDILFTSALDAIKPVYPEVFLIPLLRSGRTISIGKEIYNTIKNARDRKIEFTKEQLRSKFKHAKDFGIEGNQIIKH